LIISGQQFGRLDARSRLIVYAHGQRQSIPVTHHGFVWEAADFQQLLPVGDYSTNAFRVAHRKDGCGVPLVVSSDCDRARPFLAPERIFAATAVLRYHSATCAQADVHTAEAALVEESEPGGAGECSDCALELYDPLRIDSVTFADQSLPLAKDLSAPIAYRLRNERETVLDDFFVPRSSDVESRLFTLEPYQPGKVPVIFIHGLLSDPFTWTDMVN
jgi:hypothetical protein